MLGAPRADDGYFDRLRMPIKYWDHLIRVPMPQYCMGGCRALKIPRQGRTARAYENPCARLSAPVGKCCEASSVKLLFSISF